MRASFAALSVALAAAGCSDERVTLIFPEAWGAALLRVGDEVRAFDGGAPIVLELEGEASVLGVLYAGPLGALGVSAGSVRGVLSRPAPRPRLAAFELPSAGGEPGTPARLELEDPRLAQPWLPALDPASCAAAGLCYLAEDLDHGACIADCASPAPPPVAEPASPRSPAPPAPPRPVDFACPPAWAPHDDGGCLPPTLPSRLDCAVGEAQPRTARACAPVGDVCPANAWPASLPAGPARFVGSGPTPTGDVPYATVGAALVGAPSDALIVLSVGDHAGDVRLSGAQRLIGACAAGARLLGDLALADAASVEGLLVEGAVSVEPTATTTLSRAVVRGGPLSIRGDALVREVSLRAGARLEVEGGARLEGVTIAEAGPVALSVVGQARASDLVVRSSTTGAIEVRGELALTGALLSGATLLAMAGARVSLEDVAWAAEPGDPTPRAALELRSGARVEGARVSIARPSAGAIRVESAELRLEDALFADTGSREGAPLASATDGATLALSRARLEGFEASGIALDRGARAELTALVLRGAAGQPGRGAASLGARGRSQLTLLGASVRGGAGRGLVVEDVSTASVTDLSMSGVRSLDTYAVTVGGASTLSLSRASLDEFGEAAIQVKDLGSQAVISDLWLEARERASGAIVAELGAGLRLVRYRASGALGAALWLLGASTATVVDADVQLSGPRSGGGLVASDARLVARRVRVVEGSDVALQVEGGGRADVEDLEASTTSTRTNLALVSVSSGFLSLRRASVELSFGAAITVTEGAADLEDVAAAQLAGGEANGLSAGGGQLRGQRLRLRGFAGRAIAANHNGDLSPSPASFDVADVLVEDGAGDGIFADRGTVRVARARIERVGAPALGASTHGTLIAEDVSASGMRRGPHPKLGDAIALVQGESRLELRNVSLGGDAPVGLRFAADNGVALPSAIFVVGTVQGPARGIDLSAFDEASQDLIGFAPESIRFIGVEAPIVR